jgi:serine protease Do
MLSQNSHRPPAISPFRRVRAAALATAVGVGLALSPPAWAETALPDNPQAALSLPSFAPLVKKVMPAVVNISVTERAGTPTGDDQTQDQDQDQGQGQGQDQDLGPGQGPQQGFPSSPFDEFLRRFFEQQGQPFRNMPQRNLQRMALGSGFIIDPTGYVVTNNHVVANADKVTVIFQDNSKHPAKVIGRDSKTDLALLKIDTKEALPYVNWGDSNGSQVGDWVLAVGNPFGLGGTVSSGIISARGRDIHSGPYDDFLQIDASINRGNSGGPTFNLAGGVIGINTAIYSPNGGSVGIGFAIPSSLAKPVIEQLREHGKVERGWLGVQIQEVTPEIAKSLGLTEPEGALVAEINDGSPAAKAGIKQGDVILSFNGHDIHKVRDLPLIVAQTPIGEKAPVRLWRDGKDVSEDVAIGQMPENPKVAQNDQTGGGNQERTNSATALGLTLAPLNDNLRRRAEVPKNVKGVVVMGVADDSPLAALGIQPGDVIQSVNQQPVTTPQQAEAKLKDAQASRNKQVLLLINRHGTSEYLALSLASNDKG